MQYTPFRVEYDFKVYDIEVLRLISPEPLSVNIVKFDPEVHPHDSGYDEDGDYYMELDFMKDGVSYDDVNKRFNVIWDGKIDRIDHEMSNGELSFEIFEDKKIAKHYKEIRRIILIDDNEDDQFTITKNDDKVYSQEVLDKVKEIKGEQFFADRTGSEVVWKLFHSVRSIDNYGAFGGKTYSTPIAAKTFEELKDKIRRAETGERTRRFSKSTVLNTPR